MSDLLLFLTLSVLLYLAHCLLKINVLQLKHYSSNNIIKYFNLSYFSFCKWTNESPYLDFLSLATSLCHMQRKEKAS